MKLVAESKQAGAGPGYYGRMAVSRIAEHPRNRVFAREGEAWEGWLEDLRVNGIQQPLTIRAVGEDYQAVKGHRRLAGWAELVRRGKVRGEEVPVICREMTDEEALKELLRDNLLHEHLTPVEEGEGVLALKEDLGLSDAAIAAAVGKSVEWVRTRQLLLELGDEVRAAVVRPRGEAGHLDMGTVAVILELPLEWRAEAVQLVLHHDLYPEPPNAREARTLLKQCLVDTKAAEASWEKGRKRLEREWKKRVCEAVPKRFREGLNVLAVGWGERGNFTGLRGALEGIPEEERCEGAPEGLCWAMLAVRHGLPLRVVPGEKGVESELVVQVPVLRQLEEATGEPWLGRRKRSGAVQVEGPKKPDERVASAVAAVEGECDPGWAAEEERAPDAVVVEQVVESYAVVDLGAVRRLREWARDAEKLLMAQGVLPEKEEWLPGWVSMEGVSTEQIKEVCDWVLSLKRKAGV